MHLLLQILKGHNETRNTTDKLSHDLQKTSQRAADLVQVLSFNLKSTEKCDVSNGHS